MQSHGTVTTQIALYEAGLCQEAFICSIWAGYPSWVLVVGWFLALLINYVSNCVGHGFTPSVSDSHAGVRLWLYCPCSPLCLIMMLLNVVSYTWLWRVFHLTLGISCLQERSFSLTVPLGSTHLWECFGMWLLLPGPIPIVFTLQSYSRWSR